MTSRPPTAPVALSNLLSRAGEAVLADESRSVQVTGVTHDSREVQPGDLFAALPGEHHHGASFVERAVEQGAVAALTDEEGAERIGGLLPVLVADRPRDLLGPIASKVYGDPSSQLQIVGVTGTNGKTTTAYLVEAGMRAAGWRTGLMGTVETRVAGEKLTSIRTTPEAPDLQQAFARMVDSDVRGVAMEVSSHALALRRIDGTRLRVAIFTNLTQDHLDFHKDLEDYFKAKARLFTEALADVAVINLDDAHGERLLHYTRLPVVTFSAEGSHLADWTISEQHADGWRNVVTMHGPQGETVICSLAMLGAFNAANALGAMAALTSIGVDAPTVADGLTSLEGVPGRMQTVDLGTGYIGVVDYAHTDDALRTLLATVRQLTSAKVIVVIGCGGDRDTTKRPLMGAAAVEGADVAILTSDNPRSEDPAAILEQMLAGARAASGGELLVELDRAAAIAKAVSLAGAGDIVVIAGKGHETGQEIAGRVIPFDDLEVLRSAMEAR